MPDEKIVSQKLSDFITGRPRSISSSEDPIERPLSASSRSLESASDPERTDEITTIVMELTDFTDKGAKSTGKSPSKPMVDAEGVIYQIKRSNSTLGTRSAIGLDPDPSDSIGEFIASVIAREISPIIYQAPEGAPDLSPEVRIVTDKEGGEVRLASRYLNMTPKKADETLQEAAARTRYQGLTLDDVLIGKIGADTLEISTSKEVGHAILEANPGTLSASDEPRRALPIGKTFMCTSFTDRDGGAATITLDKKQLYRALKLSLLLGDHDVNPGNLFAVYNKDTKETNICRIDYGHAFNDLIKNWSFGRSHAPSLGEGRSNVLDFLNRTTVNGGASKFRRDYRGVIPDKDFAEVLREEAAGIDEKLAIAQAKCHEALVKLATLDNSSITSSTSKALQTLCCRLGLARPSADEAIALAVTETRKFVKANAKEMKSVANLIEIQSLVEEVGNGKIAPDVAATRMEELYRADTKYLKGKNAASKVEWVLTSEESEPKKCSLQEYIESKATAENSRQIAALTAATERAIGIASLELERELPQRQQSFGSTIRSALGMLTSVTKRSRSASDEPASLAKPSAELPRPRSGTTIPSPAAKTTATSGFKR